LIRFIWTPFCISNIITFYKGLTTRGNSYKLYQKQVFLQIEFVKTLWNSLSELVVSSGSVNIFKCHLDNFLHDQDILYNWEAEVNGIGNRSVLIII
jgi:hypothetical protein